MDTRAIDGNFITLRIMISSRSLGTSGQYGIISRLRTDSGTSLYTLRTSYRALTCLPSWPTYVDRVMQGFEIQEQVFMCEPAGPSNYAYRGRKTGVEIED